MLITEYSSRSRQQHKHDTYIELHASQQLQSHSVSGSTSTMLRKNGKPRSCEPCRIAKVRCSHETPICQKCQARGIAEQCFYHPNPMSKPAGTPRKKPDARRRKAEAKFTNSNPSRHHGRILSVNLCPSIPRDVTVEPIGNTWPTPPESGTRITQTGVDPARSFYLGSTSYAAVFTEDGPLPAALHEQPSEPWSISPSLSGGLIGQRHCHLGVGRSIVSMLTQFSFYEKAVNLYFETKSAPALIGPLIISALPQIREDLERLTNGSDMHKFYAQMTKNSALPLEVPSAMLPSQFYTLFTGENLRWEILGLILALAGSYIQFISPGDEIFHLGRGEGLNKDELLECIIQAMNDCINICNVHGAVNDIMVWLLYTNMQVISNFYGDNYHGAWRRMGECVTALYATGMHCEGDDIGEEPLFLREARRRMYASVYRSDKTLAMFFGRPPMASYRYSNRKQMLDLSDKDVTSDDPSIPSTAISKLDNSGWNTDGQIYRASFLRLRCQHSAIKERLLEQSLTGERDQDMVQNLRAISAQSTKFWDNLPVHLRYDMYSTEEEVWVKCGPGTTVRLISCYLDYLHLHFQTQRLLHRLTQQALPELLDVSMKLLTTSLASVKPNKRVQETQRHIPTVILFFCFPAAGVLALELKRCTTEGVSLPSSISRADVIRNLSVLTSCLEWIVVPGDGNHKLCTELNKMLAHILDEVLNYSPPENAVRENGTDTASSEQEFLNSPMIGGLDPIQMEAEDFLNWLDHATCTNPGNMDLFTT